MRSALLIDRMHGRDNNLALLRMVAATMVLVSHAFAIANGWPNGDEPWRATYGTTPGTVAVEVFFVISGMLLTYSLMQRRPIGEFVRARVLRIFPGLLVMLALTVFVLGPLVSTADPQDYFGSRQTWRYLLRNAVMIFGVEFLLPGVYESNPTRGTVNGSLWTLPIELQCYGALLAAYTLTALWAPLRVFKLACVAIFLASLAIRLPQLGSVPLEHGVSRLFLMFFAGSVMCIHGHRLRLHTGLFALAVAALAAGALVPRLLPWAYTIAMPFVVAWLAYVPDHRVVRAYNRVGDYSYGTYIYAFPLQQLLAHALPGITPIEMVAASSVVTAAFAVASWHGVEKPASAWRGRAPRRRLPPDPADDPPMPVAHEPSASVGGR